MKNNIELSYSKERKLQTWAQGLAVHASALWDGFVFGRESDDLFRIWGQGGVELHFDVEKGAISRARLFGDILDPAPFELLGERLIGCPYQPEALEACLQPWLAAYPSRHDELAEFVTWLRTALR